MVTSWLPNIDRFLIGNHCQWLITSWLLTTNRLIIVTDRYQLQHKFVEEQSPIRRYHCRCSTIRALAVNGEGEILSHNTRTTTMTAPIGQGRYNFDRRGRSS
ncbi:hypothetical protein TIFTF001_055083 [Ficus carica]|uniref:Uncharacterized protein n=1 Tax=Ficus carica TaxID=3494 RepID=A0AA88EAM3_FICCA|nr:hypothetical protein TIFTF001_055083 [Ficus carica]